MVNFSTVAIIGVGALLFIFRKDVGGFLNQFKGFGANFGQDFGKLPDININVPDFGIPKAFAETGETVGQIGEDINQFGIDVQKNIADSIKGAQDVIDQSISDTQKGFEQFGVDVNTNIGIIGTGITDFGTGITDFIGGIFSPKPSTTVSEAVPQVTITSRRSGTTTRFGGQTTPKEILTKTTASTPTVIKSEQPNLSLVSPFLTAFQKDPIDQPTQTITSRRTGTTGGR